MPWRARTIVQRWMRWRAGRPQLKRDPLDGAETTSMTRRLGCNLTFGGLKTLSLTTGVQRNGTYEFLIHGLGGAAVDRHVHGYALVSPDGIVIRGGARVKNKPSAYLGSGVELTKTPQEIARVTIKANDLWAKMPVQAVCGWSVAASGPDYDGRPTQSD